MLLLGLAGAVVLAVVAALLLAFRRRRQRAELQDHFHSAYDETSRWGSLDEGDGPTASND